MLMFSIDVHITDNVHGRIHTLIRLNQEIHQDENEQYPKNYEGTSKFDYLFGGRFEQKREEDGRVR